MSAIDRIREALAMSDAGYQFSVRIDDVEELLASYDALKADIEKLKDPVVVHLGMLRGGIAKPSWPNIRHLYPEEFKVLDAQTRQGTYHV